MKVFTWNKATVCVVVLGALVLLAPGTDSDEDTPVEVRAGVMDKAKYTKLTPDFLNETASILRKKLEKEVDEAREAQGLEGPIAHAYQAVQVLSSDHGVIRVGFHDGLHQLAMVGWKDGQLHLVQCKDLNYIDLEDGPCAAEVHQRFPTVSNDHIPFVWTDGIGGRFQKFDLAEGVGLKVESAPAEQQTQVTEALLRRIAEHVRSDIEATNASEKPTQQSVSLAERNGERVGIIQFVRRNRYDVRIILVLRDSELQRVSCIHRLNHDFRPPETGLCNARVQEVFGFSL